MDDKQRRDREVADLKAVMKTAGGRRFIWRQLGAAGIFAPCYTPEAEGARRYGLTLLGEIMTEAPQLFLTMQTEAMRDDQRRKIEEANHAKSRGDSDDGHPG